jgi:hypothetical protein
MGVLINTLARAAGPLAWFFVTLVIILVGCGQAFYMAFGLHLPQVRGAIRRVASFVRFLTYRGTKQGR